MYPGSAERVTICVRLGLIPTREEYMAGIGAINANGRKIHPHLNLDKIPGHVEVAESVET
ncbi:hypothetical protein GCM10027084_23440 [Pseudoxanthomonas sangjuensis]|uniref:hypothetical protein n=1 Tax=Pseudoxanthomonas sangjuensis TaxID=1503750 RepID=UPI001390D222|nr:hypothetical protein [Pseudoxanthomonas sangjuensis]KAF1713603.1 hypothetical protein CSC71_06915 [Pseudoxanthomonas sangjuensis]